MSLNYEIVLRRAVLWQNAELDRRARREFEAFCDRLSSNPFTRGSFRISDASGREHEVTIVGQCMVTWWADHAVKEVRIVDLERL